METNDKGREDRPQNIHPDEVNRNHPANEIKAQDKIDIKESELGREQSQDPADEHIEERITQIDDDTKQMQERKSSDEDTSAESKNNAGYMNDSTSADRDTGNDKDGWEESRTARHK